LSERDSLRTEVDSEHRSFRDQGCEVERYASGAAADI
jgi:hypothetical protein